MDDERTIRSPFLVVVLRFVFTPLFLLAYLWEYSVFVYLFYGAALVSDIMDGYLARRQGTVPSSPLESFLDPIADFAFVITAFYAFTLRQVYPSWLLVVFVLMFLFFVLSSGIREPFYDPVGKYYGIFLFVTIGVTLLYPTQLVLDTVLATIIVYTLVLVFSRTLYILNKRIRNSAEKSTELLPR